MFEGEQKSNMNPSSMPPPSSTAATLSYENLAIMSGITSFAVDDISRKFQRLEESLAYLSELKEPDKIVADARAFVHSLYMAAFFENHAGDPEFMQMLMMRNVMNVYQSASVIVALLEYLETICHKFCYDPTKYVRLDDIDLNDPEAYLQYGRHMVVILLSVLSQTTSKQYEVTPYYEFTVNFFDRNGAKALLSLAQNPVYMDMKDKSTLYGILVVLYNIDDNYDTDKSLWEKLKLDEWLDKLIETKGDWERVQDDTGPIPYTDLIYHLKQNIKRRPFKKMFKFYMDELGGDGSKIIQSDPFYSDLVYLCNLFNKKAFNFELFTKYKWEKVFISVLNHVFEKRDQLALDELKENEFMLSFVKYDREIDKNPRMRLAYIYTMTICIINAMLNNFESFGEAFNRKKGPFVLLSFLMDNQFVQSKLYKQRNSILILKEIVQTVAQSCKYSLDERPRWLRINSLDRLIEIADEVAQLNLSSQITSQEIVNIIRNSVHTIVTILATDRQIESMPLINTTIADTLASNLITGAILLAKSQTSDDPNDDLQYEKIFLNERNEIRTELMLYNPDGTYLSETLKHIELLAMNLMMKEKIYYQLSNTFDILLNICYVTNIKLVLKLLAQLCFDENVAGLILENKPLCETISKLRDDHDFYDLYNLLDWLLIQATMVTLNEDIEYTQANRNNKIAISFNKQSHDLAFALKNHLDEMGYQAYLTINHAIETDSNGNSRISVKNYECYGDERFQVVKECSTMICIINEYYRQSVFNQAECQYAIRLRGKNIVSIVNQDGIEPVKSSWLSHLISASSKIIDLSKILTYDECLVELNSYLEEVLPREIQVPAEDAVVEPDPEPTPPPSPPAVTSEPLPPPPPTEEPTFINAEIAKPSPLNKPVNEWSEGEVLDWLKSINIGQKIMHSLRSFNGEQLVQLNTLHNESFEFFYQSLNSKQSSDSSSLDTEEAARFGELLKKICD